MKIKSNVPVSKKEKPRKKWPFHAMKVSDVIDVKMKKADWRPVANYAHDFAAKQKPKWRFDTNWLGTFGRIRRVA